MKHDRYDHPAGIEKCPVRIFTGTSWQAAVANVVREVHLEIHLNGQKMITIACAGIHTEELAVGWLRGEGIIHTAREIEAIEVGREGMSIHVNTRPGLAAGQPISQGSGKDGGQIISSSGARSAASVIKRSDSEIRLSGAQPMESVMGAGEGQNEEGMKPLAIGTETISPARIFTLMEELVTAASIHNLSRGTHGAALADSSDIFVTREDIGRHNCLDMLSGYTFLHDIDGADKVLLRTGRVSSEIVHKIWRMGIPVVLSLSVPTALAISLAGQAGITLVGAIRAPSLTVYTHTKRIRES
ncbi:MAG: formate dehydrogenase accessory sulfurtransferase FdhD [Deltaproteobacteria bacterium]|nr:formate dehydrogenase accessory sulfurtransferase FdhD [Deltaproteobacteria bacterium]